MTKILGDRRKGNLEEVLAYTKKLSEEPDLPEIQPPFGENHLPENTGMAKDEARDILTKIDASGSKIAKRL